MANNYSEKYIRDILNSVKTIAVVGASSNPDRDSYKVMESLIDYGYEVFPVNPNTAGEIILGNKCFSSLEKIDASIDMVDVFRKTEAVMEITHQAIAINAKVLWMQLDIMHKEAADVATKAGLRVVMDKCPKKELEIGNWTSEEN